MAEHPQPPVPPVPMAYPPGPYPGPFAGPVAGPVAWGPPREDNPLDPVPVRSTKATAALTLATLGLCLMLCGGGWVPGLAALVLIGPARDEIDEAAGYLTGAGALRAAKVMSWIAVGVSAALAVGFAVWWLLGWGTADPLPDYGDTVN